MPKIAFIGTHGVGKTILTFSVASALRKVSIDADVSYENSRHSPFPINEGTTLAAQTWIFASQVKSELEASIRSSIVICDRAVLDNYAYMVRACGTQDHLHGFIRKWNETYDLFFFVPIIDETVAADKQRATSTEFQRQIQGIVEELIGKFGVKSKTIRLPQKREAHMELILHALEKSGILGTEPFQKQMF